jgi:5'-nucleotidase / UDP-sugar diphosphatase
MPVRPPMARLLLVAALAAGCTTEVDQPDLSGQDVHLTVIHTSDLHSRIFPYQFSPGQIDKGLGLSPRHGDIAIVGGAARIATVIKQERAASARVIHLDSGDIFQGAPVFNQFSGEAEMKVMTRLGLSAMVLGNHEFDKGVTNLVNMKSRYGGFPLLAANYLYSDPNDAASNKLRTVTAPWGIFNAQGLRIGVIGMGNTSSLTSIVEGGNSLGIRPLEPTQVIRQAVSVLRPMVDLLVVVSHMGLDEDETAAQTQMNNVDTCPIDMPDCMSTEQNGVAAIDGVDVIFGGHLHIVLNPPKDLLRYDENNQAAGHTVLCHSGAFGKYVGRLDLVVHVASKDKNAPVEDRKNFVKSYTYKLIPVDDSIPDDPEMANMLEPYQFALNRALNLTQNYAVVPCGNDQSTCPKVVRADPDGGDSQLGNLVAKSMRVRPRVEADFGLTNSLGIRTDFESGPLNLEQMYNVFPFENTITTMFLSGNEIAEMLNFLADKSGIRGCKSQAQVSGLWYMMDCSRADGSGYGARSCGPFDNRGNPATRCHNGAEWNILPSTACASDADCGDPMKGFFCSANVCTPLDGPPLLGDDCLRNPHGCRKILPNGEYRAAVNDYIAAGGSGFTVLKRNTTKFNTGISLRDSLIDYIRQLPGRCDVPSNSNVVYDAPDITEPTRPCTPPADPMKGPTPDEQAVIDKECGRGHVCPGDQSPSARLCSRHYDFSGLPCLDFSIEAHDGRIGHSGQ